MPREFCAGGKTAREFEYFDFVLFLASGVDDVELAGLVDDIVVVRRVAARRESRVGALPTLLRLELRLANEDAELDLAASVSSPVVAGGDVFLLCSDGVWEYLTDDVLEDLLACSRTPREWLGAMERAILRATGERATHDNYTALTVWLGPAPNP